KRAIDEVASFAKDLSARAVVFAASEAFVPTRDNRAVLKKLVTHLERKLPNAVLDLPGWPMKELDALLDKSKLTIAFDPLGEEPAKLGKLAYLRLPGPSGYRSRYDAAALDRVVSYCNACKASDVMLVLRNIDRYENGKYVAKHLEVAER
ncbi:MAG TPA: hypothetical protein VHM19_13845, partial [Polyangiales bacterium]|nr:hypothetical protein [Polyangiales bacterium]